MKKKNQQYYEELSRFFSLLSNPVRLMILDVLMKECTCTPDGCYVNEIHEKLKLPQPIISKHLKILKDADILKYTRDGNKIHYTLNQNQAILQLLNFLIPLKDCC